MKHKQTCLLLVALVTSAAGCRTEPGQAGSDHRRESDSGLVTTNRFHGIRPTDPDGRNGLRNPDRGYRIETLVGVAPGKAEWGPAHHLLGKVSKGFSDDWWVEDMRHYARDGLTLAQTYCYLDEFIDKPISQEKLQNLQTSLDRLRQFGGKALLRFAYERDTDWKTGPTCETILSHISQLTPLIQKNADVIHVMQAGFIGAWGEWHSSAHRLEKERSSMAAVLKAVLNALPPDRMTQVRVPKYKRWALSDPALNAFMKVTEQNAFDGSPASRIGFNNDGFLAGRSCGGTWPEPPLYSMPGNPEFDYMTEESPYVPVDGELFWADQAGKVDGLAAAVRMRLHHYTSFSLAHSFSDREGKPFSMDDWKKTPLTSQQARAAKLPLSDGYFQDQDGRDLARTPFDFIRDHLGYRLELQEARLPVRVRAGADFVGEVTLINRGFAVPMNPRPVFLLLIAPDEQVTEIPMAGVDPRRWQPYRPGDESYAPLTHTLSVKARLSENLLPGRYRVALWMPDARTTLRPDPRYAVRTANRDALWWVDAQGRYGANLLGSVAVTD